MLFLNAVPTSAPSSSSCLYLRTEQRRPVRIEDPRQTLAAGAQADGMTPRRQLNLASLDDGNAVFRVVVPVTAADIRLVTSPREADIAEAASRLRVVQLAFGCVDVARAAPAAPGVQCERCRRRLGYRPLLRPPWRLTRHRR